MATRPQRIHLAAFQISTKPLASERPLTARPRITRPCARSEVTPHNTSALGELVSDRFASAIRSSSNSRPARRRGTHSTMQNGERVRAARWNPGVAIRGVKVHRSIAMGCPSAISSKSDVSDSKRKISSDASRPGATRSHQMSEPPRSISTRAVWSKREPAKRDQLIGQIFQICVRCDVDARALRCPAVRRAAAIHARGAGRRYLRLRARRRHPLARKANRYRGFRRKDCARAPASLQTQHESRAPRARAAAAV